MPDRNGRANYSDLLALGREYRESRELNEASANVKRALAEHPYIVCSPTLNPLYRFRTLAAAAAAASLGPDRWVEIEHPDGSRELVGHKREGGR